jgi:hypothetical protein
MTLTRRSTRSSLSSSAGKSRKPARRRLAHDAQQIGEFVGGVLVRHETSRYRRFEQAGIELAHRRRADQLGLARTLIGDELDVITQDLRPAIVDRRQPRLLLGNQRARHGDVVARLGEVLADRQQTAVRARRSAS